MHNVVSAPIFMETQWYDDVIFTCCSKEEVTFPRTVANYKYNLLGEDNDVIMIVLQFPHTPRIGGNFKSMTKVTKLFPQCPGFDKTSLVGDNVLTGRTCRSQADLWTRHSKSRTV